MKKLKLLTIIFLGIIVLCGCSVKKNAVSGDNFKQKASELGIELKDVSSFYGLAKKAYQNTTNIDKYKILFIEGNKQTDMYSMFLDEAKNIYSKAGIQDEYEDKSDGLKTSKIPTKYVVSGKGWKSVEVKTEYAYYYLIYVNNTLLMIESTLDSQDLMIKLKDTIKY